MKFSFRSALIGFFGGVLPVLWIDDHKFISIEDRKFVKHATVIAIHNAETSKIDTFVLVPLHASKYFNDAVSKRINNGDVKVLPYDEKTFISQVRK